MMTCPSFNKRKKLTSIVSNGLHFLRVHCILGPGKSLQKYHSSSFEDTMSRAIHGQSKYVAFSLAELYTNA